VALRELEKDFTAPKTKKGAQSLRYIFPINVLETQTVKEYRK
jgi:hypothetical protein